MNLSARWLHWRDWPLGFKSAAAIALPTAFLLLALLFSYRLQQNLNAADQEVRRALTIQAEIQTLHSLIAESATGVRGYLLTGREAFLVPYRAAEEALPVTLTTLRSTLRDPEMKARLEHIEVLLDQELQRLETLRIEGRRLSADAMLVPLMDSKTVLDALRAEIRAMENREAALVAQYSDEARLALKQNLWVAGITTVLVLVTGLGAFLLLFSSVVRRVQRLAVNAEQLAQGKPLQAMPPARDELGVLAARLHNASLLLATRAAEARSASEAKTQFLSRTSHELRTPLNAILGFAQLLETDTREPAQVAYVQQILVAGRHLLTLIDDVLDIARIESGELRLSLEAQALEPLVQEVCELLAPQASARGITVQLSDTLAAVHVHADRQRLRQVLLNLLSNALKFNRPGGAVFVESRSEQHQVCIVVRDTGPGIAPAHMARLFTPFDRLDAEHGPVPGTGLGLAVSRQLMQHMGGEIAAHSTLGEGSRFELRLRVAAIEPLTAPQLADLPSMPLKIAAAGERCVLAIEDNPSNLALLQALVSRRPQWRLVTVRDGAEGLAKVRAQPPDLLLLDLHLPGMGGEALLANLRADPVLQKLPIVIISADALPDTIERLRAAGANDYLTKPLAVPRLLALLDQYAA